MVIPIKTEYYPIAYFKCTPNLTVLYPCTFTEGEDHTHSNVMCLWSTRRSPTLNESTLNKVLHSKYTADNFDSYLGLPYMYRIMKESGNLSGLPHNKFHQLSQVSIYQLSIYMSLAELRCCPGDCHVVHTCSIVSAVNWAYQVTGRVGLPHMIKKGLSVNLVALPDLALIVRTVSSPFFYLMQRQYEFTNCNTSTVG